MAAKSCYEEMSITIYNTRPALTPCVTLLKRLHVLKYFFSQGRSERDGAP